MYKNCLLVKDFLVLDQHNTTLGKHFFVSFHFLLKSLLLGLPTEPPLTLTYTERKAVREYIEEVLKTKYLPLINMVRQYEAEDPFESNKKRTDEMQKTLANRRDSTQKLLDAKSRKLELLKEVAEMRANSEQKEIVDNLLLTAKYSSLKAK